MSEEFWLGLLLGAVAYAAFGEAMLQQIGHWIHR